MNSLSTVPAASVDSDLGRLITYSIEQLRPHPSLVRLHIVPSTRDLSAAIGQQDHTIRELLTITQDRYILAGHARWSLARRQGEMNLPCLQLDMSEEQALLWLIRRYRRSSGINDFSRILLALELEPWFKERAKLNQQAGGQRKGSSKLAEADRLDVRSEIAASAGVSVGNVSKVKKLMQQGTAELLEALREGEVSIHRAFSWLKNPEKQLDQLTLHRSLRGITRTIYTLQRRHHRPHRQLDLQKIGNALAAMGSEQNAIVLVTSIQLPGEILLLSTGLLKILESQGELLS
jgi:hypothetical protein